MCSRYRLASLLPLAFPFLFAISVANVAAQSSLAEAISVENFRSSDESVRISAQPDGAVLFVAEAGSRGNPGVSILPKAGDSWDFSRFSRIEATLRNEGAVSLPVSLRVDNSGHWKTSPWSVESIRLDPGETKTVVVFFGYSFGLKKSFPLDPADVRQLLFFTSGAEKEREFTIESVVATGRPGEDPTDWKAGLSQIPEAGKLLNTDHPVTSARQLSASGGATVEVLASSAGFQIRFDKPGQEAKFSPAHGYWDLSDANHLELEIHNPGEQPIAPQIRLKSRRGQTDSTTHSVAAGGGTTRILIPFSSTSAWNPANADKGATGHDFESNSVDQVQFLSPIEGGKHLFEVRSIRAVAPVAELPDWLGKRPPVDGDWNLTFDENFDEETIDSSKWNVKTTNHWDKRSHFSAANVIVKDGVARLRFEKKTGHHNDDPEEKVTDYATGFLDTYDKWSQRYGYYEARMKLPEAPGLWPAFWMMPDRGEPGAPRWKREQTTKGGMEFDIMEFLSGWGSYRTTWPFTGMATVKITRSQEHLEFTPKRMPKATSPPGFFGCPEKPPTIATAKLSVNGSPHGSLMFRPF